MNTREVADLLKSAATIAHSADRIEDNLRAALELVCRVTGWPLGHVYLLDERAEELYPADIWVNDDPARFAPFVEMTRATRLARGVGLPGRIVESGAPAWVIDVRPDPNFPRASAAIAAGIGAGLGFPIVGRHGITGVLEFFAGEAVPPDGVLLDLLSHIGLQVGIAIDRAADLSALAAKEILLSETQHLARVGAWRYHVEADLLEFSPELCALYGYDETTAPSNFGDYLSRVHPDDLAQVRAAIERTIATHEPFDHEYRLLLPDGEIKWAHARGSVTNTAPGLIEVSGYCQDVTERRINEDTLRTIAAQLAEAQRLAHIGSWTWHVRANRVEWSDELYRIYDREPGSEVTFEVYLSAVHPDDRERVRRAVVSTLQTQVPFEHDYRIVRGDGEVRWMHARGEVVERVDGSPARLAGFCHDVTEQRVLMDRHREIENTKNSLLVAVSHQLRTPLTAIVGIAETLQREDVHASGFTPDLLERLRSNALRLDSSLADMLDLDRLTRGVVDPKPRTISLFELVERVVASFRTDRRIEVDVPKDEASIDAGLAERMIEHLIANALRYSLAEAPVRVSAARTGDGILFCVDDRGDGVPDDLKSTVFEPFIHGDQFAHAPGTGIGLALVAKFAALHGGRAWVQDNPGGGSSFRVLIPEE